MTALPFPPMALRFMAEDDEKFERIGRGLASQLAEHGMEPQSTVLDVGCGYGRLAIGLHAEGIHQGRYVGFDILPRHVGWCEANITTQEPRFEFRHLDVHNARYNPSGKRDAETIDFPVKPGTVDVAAVLSVVTHLYQPTIRHYLAQLHRALRPGGVAVATWLLWDESRLAQATSERSLYPIVHEFDPDTRYSDESDPLRAIAF